MGVRMINTCRAVDVLRIIGMLYEAHCVKDTVVADLCVTLARSFKIDGFAFGLCELFDAAGKVICSPEVMIHTNLTLQIAAFWTEQGPHKEECSALFKVCRQ